MSCAPTILFSTPVQSSSIYHLINSWTYSKIIEDSTYERDMNRVSFALLIDDKDSISLFDKFDKKIKIIIQMDLINTLKKR